MKAARLVGYKRFEILDTETPTIKPNEVLVKMEYLSICGSDLLTYDRVFPEEQYPLRVGAPCHECSGVIEESYDERWKKGQRVVALTYTGGLMEYATCPTDRLVAVPDSIAPEMAVLCQPVGTVIYAVQKLDTVLGKNVVVLGQGPIGLGFTDLLGRQGPNNLIVTDVVDSRLEVARRIGATHALNATRDNVQQAVMDLTAGRGADVVVEACGLPETCNQVFDLLRVHGTALIFGMPHGEPSFMFNWATMYSKLPNIIVTNSARAGEVTPNVQTCVDLVSSGRLDLSYLVTHRVPFEDVSRAYELFSERTEGAVKVVIKV
jgi:2-desacetyl-2-hydroxyethyl bacteriochlorophyllide A dehydrogenase